MSFVYGYSVSSKWFDGTGLTPVEERRLNTLENFARAMPQLQRLQFIMIGSLESEGAMSENRIKVGPCYRWDEGVFGDDNHGRSFKLMSLDHLNPPNLTSGTMSSITEILQSIHHLRLVLGLFLI